MTATRTSCFLDVHMPGLSGVEAAHHDRPPRAPGVRHRVRPVRRCRPSREGVLDYLVKPVEQARLAETVARLKERLQAAQPALEHGGVAAAARRRSSRELQSGAAPAPLRWIRAQAGSGPAADRRSDDIDYLRSGHEVHAGRMARRRRQPGEALVRTRSKDLVAQLDPAQFAQVHRSVVVNLRAISHVTRGENETADIHLKGRAEVLPVSRSYLHLFRQM